jgi:hypothetical protein
LKIFSGNTGRATFQAHSTETHEPIVTEEECRAALIEAIESEQVWDFSNSIKIS